MKNTALIVIDVQDSFLETPYWQPQYFADFQSKMLKLITQCVTHNVPVVQILHASPTRKESPFNPASGLVRAMTFLPESFDVSFTKHVHNAFTDTQLDAWLRSQNIERLLISGIRTEQCCETTTRVASDLGYQVDFVMDATLTFDMQDHLDRTISAEEIKARTRLVLENRFARVVNVEQLTFSERDLTAQR